MSDLSILLIEDTPAHARLFIRNIRQQFEDDPSTNVRVEWYEAIDPALEFLRRVGGVDQIFCDRGLPGFESDAAFEAALRRLKPYALDGETRILTQSTDPALYEHAKEQHVQVIQKGSEAYDSLVPELIRLALAKRSNSTLSLANIELQRDVAKLQVGLEQVQERQRDVMAAIEVNATLRPEVEAIKRSLTEILDKLKTQETVKTQHATTRLTVVATIVAALLAGVFGLLNVLAPLTVPKLIEQVTHPAPSPGTTPPKK